MDCLTLSKLLAFHNHLLAPEEEHDIKRHVDECEICQKRITTYEQLALNLKRSVRFEKMGDHSECYEVSEIVSFIESRPEHGSHSKFYLHLTTCNACMESFLALENMLNELKAKGLIQAQDVEKLKKARPLAVLIQDVIEAIKSSSKVLTMPSPVYRWAGIAVILMAAAIFFLPGDPLDRISFITREPARTEYGESLRLIYPGDEMRISESNPEFRWENLEEASKYTLLLLDANGDIMWEETTNRTEIRLPEGIELHSSSTYFWQVEAQFDDGSTVVSGMSGFSISP